MKLTTIEKLMTASIIIIFTLLIICLTMLSKALDKMNADGGLKAAISNFWNGNTNN